MSFPVGVVSTNTFMYPPIHRAGMSKQLNGWETEPKIWPSMRTRRIFVGALGAFMMGFGLLVCLVLPLVIGPPVFFTFSATNIYGTFGAVSIGYFIILAAKYSCSKCGGFSIHRPCRYCKPSE